MYSGVEAFSNYGFIYSHTSYTGDSTSTYGNGLRQKWHIRVQQGYRVKITFLGFELEGCCDYVYLTWDVCDYNGAYSVRLGGSSLATTVYYSPPRVNNVNVYFYTDHSVTRPSVSTSFYTHIQPLLSLVKLINYCPLIGRDGS